MERNKLKDPQCVPWIIAATKRAPIKSSASVANQPLELTHTNISEPIKTASKNNRTNTDVFIDYHSRISMVYFLEKEFEFFEILKGYKSFVEN